MSRMSDFEGLIISSCLDWETNVDIIFILYNTIVAQGLKTGRFEAGRQ